MRKSILASLTMLLTVCAATSAFAAAETGNLTVTTTIQAGCNAPSPSGNLSLPFSTVLGLSGSQVVSDQVAVTVTCTGNPSVTSVAFGDGLYAADTLAGTVGAGKFRAMKRTSGTGADTVKTNYLGYKLYASKTTAFVPTDVVGTDTFTTASVTAPDYTLALGDTGTSTFYVKGKVYEANTTRAWTSAAAVTGGTYNDTVIMTISY